MAKKELTQQRMLAIDAWFENGYQKTNAMQAAGYSEKTAQKRQAIVFGREDVKAEIQRRQAKSAKKHELNQDWVIKRLMARADAPTHLAKFKKIDTEGQLYWDFTGATQAELGMVQDLGVEFTKAGRGNSAVDVTKFKMKDVDAHAALMALSRHLGLFDDKITVTEGSLEDKILAGRRRLNMENAKREEDIIH
tara:strand:- start:16 stop:594 length:579 start_codon:yes stop_codon:yes gene_type:complete